jgi:L-threonylcarbamoyladenylate synthase
MAMKGVKLMDVLENERIRGDILSRIRHGSVFVYPTDTVYGIGCNAIDREAVQRVRDLKGTDHPFSVIAPSLDWIRENFEVGFPEYLDRLPGPVTLIFQQKGNSIPGIVSDTGKVGVRIPNHPFTSVIQKAGIPFISTSANISGEKTITRITEVPREISEKIDYAVDAGVLDNPPSTVIDLTGKEPEVIRE